MMGACLIRARPALDAAPPACVVYSYTGHNREGAPCPRLLALLQGTNGAADGHGLIFILLALLSGPLIFFLLLLGSFMGVESFVLKTRIYWMGI